MEALLEQMDTRNTSRIAATQWERRAAHQNLTPMIENIKHDFADHAGKPDEIAISEDRPYTAKA
jgi:hypothetical protein